MACTSDGGPGPPVTPEPTVASVELVIAATSIVVGGVTQATATPRDAAGRALSGRLISWSSSHPAIASVSPSGQVTGMSAGGPVTISATVESAGASVSITVTPVPVAHVAVALGASSIVVGGATLALATITDANGVVLTDRPVQWSSSNASIATVSQAGMVTGVSPGGPVIISAAVEGVVGGAPVTITPVPVATVSVTLASSSIQVGNTTQASATLRDAGNNVLTGRLVSWNTSHPSLATISPGGVVTGVSPGGPVTITATSEGVSGVALMTIVAPSPPPACLDAVPVGEPGCPVTAVDYRQQRPGVSGNRIVWEDYRNGLPAIFMMDIGSQVSAQLTPPNTENLLPVIDGDRVVYVRAQPCPGPWQVFTYDIASRTETLFHQIDCTVGLGRFSLSGNRVTWHERVAGNWDVYVYDFATSSLMRMTTDPADQADPSIHGDYLVWSDKRHGGLWWDLYTYDFVTRTERRLTQSSTLGRSGIASADKVVWGDTRGGFFRLYRSTLQGSPTEVPVNAPLLENDIAASESGRYAAWVNRNDANPAFYDDIFVHDFQSNVTTRVTRHLARQWAPALTDEYIAWEDYRGGMPRVYLLRLSRLPP